MAEKRETLKLRYFEDDCELLSIEFAAPGSLKKYRPCGLDAFLCLIEIPTERDRPSLRADFRLALLEAIAWLDELVQ